MKVTLCGSLKFERSFHEWNERLTLAGHTVYDCAIHPSTKDGKKDWYDDATKQTLDLIHLSKIEESDAILVVNVGQYVGASTMREIEWARIRGKEVYSVEAMHRAGGADLLLKSHALAPLDRGLPTR